MARADCRPAFILDPPVSGLRSSLLTCPNRSAYIICDGRGPCQSLHPFRAARNRPARMPAPTLTVLPPALLRARGPKGVADMESIIRFPSFAPDDREHLECEACRLITLLTTADLVAVLPVLSRYATPPPSHPQSQTEASRPS